MNLPDNPPFVEKIRYICFCIYEKPLIGRRVIVKTLSPVFLPLADKLYITKVDKSFEADVFFPEIDPDIWELTGREEGAGEGLDFTYSFLTYERKK